MIINPRYIAGHQIHKLARYYYSRKNNAFNDVIPLLGKIASSIKEKGYNYELKIKNGQIWIRSSSNVWLRYNNGLNSVTHVALTHGDFEAEELGYFKAQLPESGTFIDIGANVGLYSLMAAKEKGLKCYSFEPVPSTMKDLIANITENDCKHLINPVALALSDHAGKMNITSDYHASNFLLDKDANDIPHKTINVIKLDDFVKENNIKKVTAVKIDVEGHELKVLEGATKVITNHRPIFFIEVILEDVDFMGRPKYSHEELFEIFRHNNYSSKIIDGKSNKSRSYRNYMFLPK